MSIYKVNHFINGEFVDGVSGEYSDIYNPAIGEVVGHVSRANDEDLDRAVTVAQKAFNSWSKVTPLRRSRVMFKYKALLEEHMDEMAAIISREHGKVIEDAKGEIIRGLEVVEFACGAPHLLKGEYSANVGTEVDCLGIRQPHGVVAGITPFNFPAMIPMWMFPMALVCGNTFVLKVASHDPSTANLMATLLQKAGLPDGVFNVVHGGRQVVQGMLHHPDIKAISFVGSSTVAEIVYTTGTKNGKRVQALGAAKNHAIIMPDADLDMVADNLMGAAYGAAGERCMAISVAVAVGDKVADTVIEKVKERIPNLKIAAGDVAGAEMGALYSKAHLEAVTNYIAEGVEEGAELVVDGRPLTGSKGYEKGFFIGASLFDHVKPGMKIYDEEIFGPVLCVCRVPDFESAVELINNHNFANGTAIFTNDGGTARAFSDQIQVGMVGINVPIPVPMAFHSFGGWKASIYGDFAMHGMEGIRFFTKLKTITVRWPQGSISDPEFVMPTH
ncbi:MAG: CoA-acylating methylmalonate-semialdehyde dehydrogenase [Lentisphaerae bacterium]|nr:CoA-acylating methylmalonate-semialdehyde dehydrogenase [Lentisphaerota bacterium]MCP4103318.1 CoA-acylating methylmalonate-semialdehyde dehydrogenase [Lentisphaerota bacterium]